MSPYGHPLLNHMPGPSKRRLLVSPAFAFFSAATIWKYLSPWHWIISVWGCAFGIENKSHSQAHLLGTKPLLPGTCVDPSLSSLSVRLGMCGPKNKPGSPCGPRATVLCWLWALSSPTGELLPQFLPISSDWLSCLKLCFPFLTWLFYPTLNQPGPFCLLAGVFSDAGHGVSAPQIGQGTFALVGRILVPVHLVFLKKKDTTH